MQPFTDSCCGYKTKIFLFLCRRQLLCVLKESFRSRSLLLHGALLLISRRNVTISDLFCLPDRPRIDVLCQFAIREISLRSAWGLNFQHSYSINRPI